MFESSHTQKSYSSLTYILYLVSECHVECVHFVKKKHSFEQFEYIIVGLKIEKDGTNDEIIKHLTLNLKVFISKMSGKCPLRSIQSKIDFDILTS